MNGLASPTTMHWLTSGWARSRSSRTAGATFLPGGRHQDLLLAAGDRDEAVVVDVADVAGVEPPVDHRLRGGGRVVPVAAVDVVALHQQLAVLGHPDGHAGEGRPTLPMRRFAGVLTVPAAIVSVSPQPSRMVSPMPR
jgi:hypothetical protein